eukprot:TRINITY_DN8685_c0_g1_i1.p1 TRINITY_DN8685_c0_g1~~TRINITY_DN8685_c0_g1_i1.p1  ORF type:complete len:415 (+),score=121.49 TRINITY_DN8685_c0_g1_i1:36-1280(+)
MFWTPLAAASRLPPRSAAAAVMQTSTCYGLPVVTAATAEASSTAMQPTTYGQPVPEDLATAARTTTYGLPVTEGAGESAVPAAAPLAAPATAPVVVPWVPTAHFESTYGMPAQAPGVAAVVDQAGSAAFSASAPGNLSVSSRAAAALPATTYGLPAASTPPASPETVAVSSPAEFFAPTVTTVVSAASFGMQPGQTLVQVAEPPPFDESDYVAWRESIEAHLRSAPPQAAQLPLSYHAGTTAYVTPELLTAQLVETYSSPAGTQFSLPPSVASVLQPEAFPAFAPPPQATPAIFAPARMETTTPESMASLQRTASAEATRETQSEDSAEKQISKPATRMAEEEAKGLQKATIDFGTRPQEDSPEETPERILEEDLKATDAALKNAQREATAEEAADANTTPKKKSSQKSRGRCC